MKLYQLLVLNVIISWLEQLVQADSYIKTHPIGNTKLFPPRSPCLQSRKKLLDEGVHLHITATQAAEQLVEGVLPRVSDV
jgi:hypothetical protein